MMSYIANYKIFPTVYSLAEKFAEELINKVIESSEKKELLTIALSGGSTPELLFSLLGDNFSNAAPWENLHIFWGDERCVAPDSQESNYGMARRKWLDKIDIPAANIHRIRGEEDPVKEALRYSNEISGLTKQRDGLPVFDLIVLGLGEDGHTASIFPGNTGLFTSEKICEEAVHPVTLQKRITLTGRVLNNAVSVVFLVTGRKKSEIVGSIFSENALSANYPASYVVPVYGELNWYFDEEASSLLKK